MQVQPYLFFEGRTEEAIEFYKKALGAKAEMVMRFKDSPEGQTPPGSENKVMHASFRVGDTHVMASDGMCAGKPSFQGFSLSVEARDEQHAKRMFEALAEGGKVQQPLIKTFFSPKFGMLADKFGMNWMVLVEQQ